MRSTGCPVDAIPFVLRGTHPSPTSASPRQLGVARRSALTCRVHQAALQPLPRTHDLLPMLGPLGFVLLADAHVGRDQQCRVSFIGAGTAAPLAQVLLWRLVRSTLERRDQRRGGRWGYPRVLS